MSTPANLPVAGRIVPIVSALLAIVGSGLVLLFANAWLGVYALVPGAVVLVLSVVLFALVIAASWRAVRRATSAVGSVVVIIATGSLLAYLVWDDAAPPPEPSLAPVMPRDSRGFQVYSWLLRDAPGSRLTSLPAPKGELPHFSAKPEEWSEFVKQNRAAWERGWTEDTLAREWIDAMAAAVPEGHYPNEGLATPLLDFPRVRRAVQLHWARAHLQLLDGHADDAARTLLTVLRVGHHLQQAGTTLVTQMIAIVDVKGSYQRLGLLLDSGTVSPATKAEIRAALQEAPDVRQNIARAFTGEEIFMRTAIAKIRDSNDDFSALGLEGGRLHLTGRLLGAALFNPNQTERQQRAFLEEISGAVQNRDASLADVRRRFDVFVVQRPLKNPVGHVLSAMAIPAFGKVKDSFWQTEDLRLALLRQLDT